jgi:hypothetical protein
MYRFREKGTPEILQNFIAEVLPEGELKPGNGVDFINQITDGFRSKLGNQHYVGSFIIEREKNQFFCLFFFTSNKLGFTKMLEAKWRIDKEDGRGWQLSDQTNLFSQVASPANTGRLTDLLVEFIGKEGKTNNEIRDFALTHEFLPKHVKDVLSQKRGIIEIVSLDGQKPSGFYIGNEKRNVLIKLK